MKKTIYINLFCLLCICLVSCRSMKWEPLFNEKDMTGWRILNGDRFPEKGWTIRENAIVCTGERGGSIVTRDKYSNFELEWEWKLTRPGANSGVKYFLNEIPGDTDIYGFGIEYQMIDDEEWVGSGRMKPNDYHTTGAAYELYTPSPKKKLNPVGQWNKSRIVSKNGQVEHWLNGEKILEYNRFSQDFLEKVKISKFAKIASFGQHNDGHILLQDHDSEVYFRDIRIRRL